MARWKFFDDDEIKGLDTQFVAKLDDARGIAGVPFRITSGRRSEAENRRVGGTDNSAHLSGRAVDLRSRGSSSHFKILKGAYLSGIKRIGVYFDEEGEPSHIHLDDASDLPQEVLWFGKSK